MANAFTVTASALKNLADELEQLNSHYKDKVERLSALEVELRSMWEGDANTAFRNAFNNDKVNLDNFYTVIGKYILALRNAADEYSNAEIRAAEIATTRTYH